MHYTKLINHGPIQRYLKQNDMPSYIINQQHIFYCFKINAENFQTQNYHEVS